MAWRLQIYCFVQRPRHLVTLPLALALFGLTLAGCEVIDIEPEMGSRQQAIVNGSVDTTHLAVGLLHSGGTSACTATLIGPRTLLTAAHCLASESAPYRLLSPIYYYPGGFNGSRVEAESVSLHPDFAGADKADLAVVRLAETMSDAPARLALVAPKTGEQVDLVGYGKTGETSGDFGTRRQAVSSIGLVDPQTIRFLGASSSTGNLCNGDSGGPTFATRAGLAYLIGVHTSKGGSCGQEGNDMRVDSFVRWIVGASAGDVASELDLSTQAGPASENGHPSSPTSDSAAEQAAGCSVIAAGAPPPGLTLVLLLGLLVSLLLAPRRPRRR